MREIYALECPGSTLCQPQQQRYSPQSSLECSKRLATQSALRVLREERDLRRRTRAASLIPDSIQLAKQSDPGVSVHQPKSAIHDPKNPKDSSYSTMRMRKRKVRCTKIIAEALEAEDGLFPGTTKDPPPSELDPPSFPASVLHTSSVQRVKNSLIESESGSDVIFLVGSKPDVQRIPAHSWILAENSPVFKAMFRGPLNELRRCSSSGSSNAVVPGSARPIGSVTSHGGVLKSGNTAKVAALTATATPLPSTKRRTTIPVSDVDGRAFDILLSLVLIHMRCCTKTYSTSMSQSIYLLSGGFRRLLSRTQDVYQRYLYNETVQLQSVMTALTTLYAAHKYMCPGLAKIVVKYLKENLSEKNVLLVLQHICLYCSVVNEQQGQHEQTPHVQQPGKAHYWDVPITESPRAYFAASSAEDVLSNRQRPDATSRFREVADDFVEDDEEEEEQEEGIEEEDPFGDRYSPSAPPLEDDPLLAVDDENHYSAGMASSLAPGKRKQKVDCCNSLMKECLELIDARATAVLESEDIEDIDISALKMVICRETLCVRSELDVYRALLRWSGRECKRQKIEITRSNRRRVLEGGQYLVRYLTLSQEDFIEASGLLSEEEQDALLSIISCDGSDEPLPDHLIGCRNIMKTKRRGKSPPHGISLSSGRRRFPTSLGRIKRSKKEKRALAEKERRTKAQLHKPEKEKFNIIEEFFVCLACIFD
ncbi:hypothetical protein TCAL_04127 [Tigriopus californicus]|uniref:BTB domain-containing protein n=1 Tax=Tigriopus californicus TaxID=6832 RepID=A0A553NSE3_TIGCA|nr:hypothetical protein TCAL_04127 [Tigriopus californicus]